jgi:hypothetical protein
MNKTCSVCKIKKQPKDFNLKSSNPDGLQRICRICSNKASKKYYQKNKDKHIKNTSLNREKYYKRNREYVYNLLLNSCCIDCGISDPIVLEFDHIKDKVKDISKMIVGYSMKSLKNEIKKCEIVCANCHRRRTAKTFKWYADLK